MTNSRQLAAIMFTDIQGYTALMQRDEKKAVHVRTKHRQVFNSTTKKHSGRILQYYGDGTLSIFDSAIEAVECAIEMQLGFQEDPGIPVRIGIHSGDIILRDEEIIGDSVNVASRIESLAIAGSILISDKVYDEIKNQNTIKTIRLQKFHLKNVEKPIDVYAISNTGLAIPKLEQIRGKTAPITRIKKPERSIAVLAFENMSGDPEQEYFSDGISEEIITALSKVEGLKVAGRTSAFSFKGRNENIRRIGDQLNVKMVLEGSLRKAGNHIRVTAQLINVEDGFHIWSEIYKREMDDIFAVQEDIANHITSKLKLQIRETFDSKTDNVEAYELLLKGNYYLRKGFESQKDAMECFTKAAGLDPEYAKAYAFIAETYLYYAGNNTMSTTEAYSNGRKYAQKALSLNAYEPHAHKVLAYIHFFYDWDWEATQKEYNKALQYGLPEQNEFITYYHIFLKGDYERAIRVSKQILETDPLHAGRHWQLGICYYFSRRFKEAIATAKKALEIDPNFAEAHQLKGTSLGFSGKYEEAIGELQMALEITKGEGPVNVDLIMVNILMGKREKAMQMMKSHKFVDPGDAAHLYVLLGMNDEAMNWLEKAYKERSVMMITLQGWIWDPIRDDPRFIEIYNRMNF